MDCRVHAIIDALSLQNPFADDPVLSAAPAVPRVQLPAAQKRRTAASSIAAAQRVINQLEYNFLPQTFFPLQKLRPLKLLMVEAKEMVQESLPIRCLEACFLAIFLTQELEQVSRVPLSFDSLCDGNVYHHIVLAVRYEGCWGAMGLSRRDTLMDKPMAYKSLADLIDDFRVSYAQHGHALRVVRIGLSVSHDSASVQVPCWRFLQVTLPSLKEQAGRRPHGNAEGTAAVDVVEALPNSPTERDASTAVEGEDVARGDRTTRRGEPREAGGDADSGGNLPAVAAVVSPTQRHATTRRRLRNSHGPRRGHAGAPRRDDEGWQTAPLAELSEELTVLHNFEHMLEELSSTYNASLDTFEETLWLFPFGYSSGGTRNRPGGKRESAASSEPAAAELYGGGNKRGRSQDPRNAGRVGLGGVRSVSAPQGHNGTLLPATHASRPPPSAGGADMCISRDFDLDDATGYRYRYECIKLRRNPMDIFKEAMKAHQMLKKRSRTQSRQALPGAAVVAAEDEGKDVVAAVRRPLITNSISKISTVAEDSNSVSVAMPHTTMATPCAPIVVGAPFAARSASVDQPVRDERNAVDEQQSNPQGWTVVTSSVPLPRPPVFAFQRPGERRGGARVAPR